MLLLLKHKSGEIFVEKYFVFTLYHTNYKKLITCSGLFFLLVQSKLLIRVHNIVQINILIGMHCSESLGFSFKNHGWQFGVVTPWGFQMKTASLLQSAKIQTEIFSHALMPFKRA